MTNHSKKIKSKKAAAQSGNNQRIQETENQQLGWALNINSNKLAKQFKQSHINTADRPS